MNERIKELAVKSGGFRDEGKRLVSRFIEDTDMSDEIQEFAELIIKECIGVIKETNLIDDDPVVNIKEHFGVK